MRTSPRKKLQDLVADASSVAWQAMRDGTMQGWDRNHPSVKRLDALNKRMVDAQERSIRRLQRADQDKLFERWKSLRLKHCRQGLTKEEFERYRETKLHFLDHPHPEITRIEKQHSDRMGIIVARVVAAVKPPLRLRYSAYRRDELGIPIDNLDEVAVTGHACFVYDPNVFPDVPCPVYRSPVVENPTWLHVAQLANDMIQTCELEEHTFLESIHLEKEVDGVKEMRFRMGS